MWWRDARQRHRLVRLAAALAAASLTAGCWQPLYGTSPVPGAENVQDKFAGIDIPPMKVGKGTPDERIAVALRNALQFDLHNGANTYSPSYTLKVTVTGSQFTAELDPVTGRPNTQIEAVNVAYELIEIATGKVAVKDTAFSRVDYDLPGSEQRFAGQRARRDAEDRAVLLVAETIRNRLASYFVAGT
jgi:LPS-assembly lipoprotein